MPLNILVFKKAIRQINHCFIVVSELPRLTLTHLRTIFKTKSFEQSLFSNQGSLKKPQAFKIELPDLLTMQWTKRLGRFFLKFEALKQLE